MCQVISFLCSQCMESRIKCYRNIYTQTNGPNTKLGMGATHHAIYDRDLLDSKCECFDGTALVGVSQALRGRLR